MIEKKDRRKGDGEREGKRKGKIKRMKRKRDR